MGTMSHGAEPVDMGLRPQPRAPPAGPSVSRPAGLPLPGLSPSLRAARATWGPLSSSSLPEELPLLSLLSSEVLEALALGRPEGVVMARWTVGTAGFLSLLVPLACAGALWGLVTGSVPRALPI